MSSVLDRGLTSGGIHRLAWFVPIIQVPTPHASVKIISYVSTKKTTKIRTTSLKLAKTNIRALNIVGLLKIKDCCLFLYKITQSQILTYYHIRCIAVNHIILKYTSIIKSVMSLPTNEVKGTTILFEVQIDLNIAAPDALLTYFGEGADFQISGETFLITSLPTKGISLLSNTEANGVFSYKWRCRVAPELTRNLKNDVFNTYCRLFFGNEVVELEQAKLVLKSGKPDLRPT